MKQQNCLTSYIERAQAMERSAAAKTSNRHSLTKTLVAPLMLAAALGTSPAVNAALGTDPVPVDPKLQPAQDALLNTLATLTPGTPQFTAVAKALEILSTVNPQNPTRTPR